MNSPFEGNGTGDQGRAGLRVLHIKQLQHSWRIAALMSLAWSMFANSCSCLQMKRTLYNMFAFVV